MVNIFLNGLNAKAGGGKSILNNYLTLLIEKASDKLFFVLTPDAEEYRKYETDWVKIVDIPAIYKNKLAFPLVYSTVVPRLLKQLKIDLVFNLSDIPLKTNIRQIFLFDWSYAVYPHSIVWQMMTGKDFIVRKIKLFYFKRYLKYIDLIVAQTDTMKAKLTELFNCPHVIVVPNAVSLENMEGGEKEEFGLPKGTKLLYLTHYYPHKNLEIFIPLAQEIKKKNLDYKLITTIDPDQHADAKKFLDNIVKLDIGDVICNVGAVTMKHVPSLYKQCDGLLMPTLLESFSGTYVEAMYHKIPIFTSDIDFAKGVCYDGAEYFNPMDIHSILEKLDTVYLNEKKKKELVLRATRILDSLPDWNQVITMYSNIIEKVLKNGN